MRVNYRHLKLCLSLLLCQPADAEVGRLVEEAEKLRQLNHHDAPAISREVSAMDARWQRFLSRMEDHRTMLEASIEFHQLYEQVCPFFDILPAFCWCPVSLLQFFSDLPGLMHGG